ncbi:1-aminocyclopropane-1-carboxylate deaminase/D-cysteine desulfhydrase [Chitinophaga japonensis]|uniref:1-aminocyclopropane-1-carboxylate deaminase n=1 Tax=Chitinophaga japonensis TaxID=104662 RepID=A0A562T5Y0_CHIJA|nr:pyridoxal-phosphate dependent enzyme [Chitinophaga japonensis]TWI88410.1 1-aminocyclopropane-1-carboxylate deaminase [Chitinophaga japonensis]
MRFSIDPSHITLQTIQPAWLPPGVEAAMLRLDRLHPDISGNKWFKLKYNLETAEAAGKTHIVTFGGAWSNHIAATALACRMAGLSCTGIIRGEAPPAPGHTLQQARQQGMELCFISREAYREKDTTDWEQRFPNSYIIPEGGHNAAGVRGCREILPLAADDRFTHIACAVGTGTTLAGLVNSAGPQQEVLGVVVLKGAGYLQEEVAAMLEAPVHPRWRLLHDFHLGGYARVTPALIACINQFYTDTHIPLDIIYTGKMVYGVEQLAQQGYFPAGSRILLVHTGGLQGNLSLPPGVLKFQIPNSKSQNGPHMP